MGRRIRTDVPQVKELLIPVWPHAKGFKEMDKKQKQKQKRDFDKRHRTRVLPMLPEETKVWVDTPSGQVPGSVVQHADTPRSYHVQVPSGQVRRNRRHLRIRGPVKTNTSKSRVHQPQSTRLKTRSCDGTAPGPPDYLRM